MSIHFHPHALKRIQQRFPGRFRELARLLESGISRPCGAARDGRWQVTGRIGGRTAVVVFRESAPAEFWIVTVYSRPR